MGKYFSDDEIQYFFKSVSSSLEKFYKKLDSLKISRIRCLESDYEYFDNRIKNVKEQIEFYEKLLFKISKLMNMEE